MGNEQNNFLHNLVLFLSPVIELPTTGVHLLRLGPVVGDWSILMLLSGDISLDEPGLETIQDS